MKHGKLSGGWMQSSFLRLETGRRMNEKKKKKKGGEERLRRETGGREGAAQG